MVVAILLIFTIIVSLIFIVFLITIVIFGTRLLLKGEKIEGLIVLGVFFCIIAMLVYFIFFSNKTTSNLTNTEIKNELENEKIPIKENFTIIDSYKENDFYYYKTKFNIKISEADFAMYKSKKSDSITVIKYNTSKKQSTYDTIKISISKDKILHFYKSQYDYSN